MSRYIDADALTWLVEEYKLAISPITEEQERDNRLPLQMLTEFENIIAEHPTVDAVPVVRCGECKHFIEPSWECRKLIDRDAYGEADARVYPDYFCADGEQKDGESRLHCENTCADGERRTDGRIQTI